MKKLFLMFVVPLGAFVIASTSGAALINNSDGTVTDDDIGVMWLLEPGPDANFTDAVTWADTLVFAGYDDWRLPLALDFDTGSPDEVWNSTNNEFGHLYGTELGNPANASEQGDLTEYSPLWYWTGTTDGLGDPYAFFWSWDNLWLNLNDHPDIFPEAVLNVTALRVIDGNGDSGDDGSSVPEPATTFLFGTGIVGLASIRIRRKKRE